MVSISAVDPEHVDEAVIDCIGDVWAELNQRLGKTPDPRRMLQQNQDYWRKAIDPILLLARDAGTVVGFRFGHRYEYDESAFYDQHGGTRPKYRNRGISKALIAEQHRLAANYGYTRIYTDTAISLTPMIRLNLVLGFEIADTGYNTELGVKYLRFVKKLT